MYENLQKIVPHILPYIPTLGDKDIATLLFNQFDVVKSPQSLLSIEDTYLFISKLPTSVYKKPATKNKTLPSLLSIAGLKKYYGENKETVDKAGIAAVAGGTVCIGLPWVISYMGFTAGGVTKGSIASWIQSSYYGGETSGLFSYLQSVGVLGIGIMPKFALTCALYTAIEHSVKPSPSLLSIKDTNLCISSLPTSVYGKIPVAAAVQPQSSSTSIAGIKNYYEENKETIDTVAKATVAAGAVVVGLPWLLSSLGVTAAGIAAKGGVAAAAGAGLPSYLYAEKRNGWFNAGSWFGKEEEEEEEEE